MRVIRRFAHLALGLLSVGASQALGAQERWTLRETLRIGGEDEGPYLFSDIRGVAVGSGGTIFVLDFKAQEIRLFDAQGKFVKRVARRGAGPGEIQNANGLLTAPDGRVWVNDPSNARFSVFAPDGEFQRQVIVPIWGYQWIWEGVFLPDGALLEYLPIRSDGASSREAIRRFRPDGSLRDTLNLPGCSPRGVKPEDMTFAGRSSRGGIYMSVPFLPTPVNAWDRRGYIWCAPRDRYVVMQLGIERGDTLTTLVRDVPPIPVTNAEREAAIAGIRKAFRERGFPDPDFSRVPRTKPVINKVDVDGAGRVWVRRAAGDSMRTYFDVWSDRGTLVATVEAPFRLFGPRPLFRGDTVYAVTVDQDDVPAVVRAVMVRGGTR